MTDRRASVAALMRLLAAVVGLAAGAQIYGRGHGVLPGLTIGLAAAVCAYWIVSLVARKLSPLGPAAPRDLERELPMRKDVSARKRGRNRRLLLRHTDAPQQNESEGLVE